MGKTYDLIDDRLSQFIRAQQMFFVATAPLADGGSINLSPRKPLLRRISPEPSRQTENARGVQRLDGWKIPAPIP